MDPWSVKCGTLTVIPRLIVFVIVADARATAEASFHPRLYRPLADRLGQRLPRLCPTLRRASYPYGALKFVCVRQFTVRATGSFLTGAAIRLGHAAAADADHDSLLHPPCPLPGQRHLHLLVPATH